MPAWSQAGYMGACLSVEVDVHREARAQSRSVTSSRACWSSDFNRSSFFWPTSASRSPIQRTAQCRSKDQENVGNRCVFSTHPPRCIYSPAVPPMSCHALCAQCLPLDCQRRINCDLNTPSSFPTHCGPLPSISCNRGHAAVGR